MKVLWVRPAAGILKTLLLRRIGSSLRAGLLQVDRYLPEYRRAVRRPEIDLEKIVQRGNLDPVYLNSAYYLYPDGPIAVEALRVIGAAMAEAGVGGLGQLTLSRRERMVMVEPRGVGMALFTLRAADEVRASQFGGTDGELDAEMVGSLFAVASNFAH